MPHPVSPEEHQELDQLAWECGESPARLRATLLELIRLRSFASIASKHRERLPQKVQKALADKLPDRLIESEWARLAGSEGAPELVGDGLPIPRSLDLPL